MQEKEQQNPKFITIINDSRDDNAQARQETRWASLFPSTHISFIGVSSKLGERATLEASGNLIDTLDAGDGKAGIVAVNVAPRGEKEEDGDNGSPFAYFWYKSTLIISTIKGYNLSLVKKLKITDYINLLNTKEVLCFAEQNNLITEQQNDYISNTQFRSFDFQPRVAKWIFKGFDVPYKKLDMDNIPEAPGAIWYIDSFGNLKSTLTFKDISNRSSKILTQEPLIIKTGLGELPYYDRLKDVPAGETAIYTGSSGLEDKRFLEIAKQNSTGSAQKQYRQTIGSKFEVV